MCVQYRGGAQYLGDIQYSGGYHDKCANIFEYHGDIMNTVVDILSIVEILSTLGAYHDAYGDIMSTVGCSVPWGSNLLLFEYPHGTEDPHGTHDNPHGTHYSPMVLNDSYGTQDPTFIMISPMILNTPTVLNPRYSGCGCFLNKALKSKFEKWKNTKNWTPSMLRQEKFADLFLQDLKYNQKHFIHIFH